MASVQLPTVGVDSQQTQLQAELRTSLRFCQPSRDDITIQSADDMLRMRKEENLWILPAPACRLHVSMQLLGRVAGQSLDRREVAGWIEDSDVWERLKLRVSCCDMSGDSTLEFSIQHPDLSASLICPPTAARIELQDISCHVEISTAPRPRRTRKRKRDADTAIQDGRPMHPPGSTVSAGSGLNAEDRVAVHNFVAGLNSQEPENTLLIGGIRHGSRNGLENLVKAAVAMLVTGSTRHLPEARARQSSTAHALVKLAPAVFNVPYVKSISDRARHLPVIASAVAALQEAQSPRLRRKLEALLQRRNNLAHAILERHVWNSIVSQAKIPSVPAPKTTVGGRAPCTSPLDQVQVSEHFQNREPLIFDFSNEATSAFSANSSLSSDLISFGEDVSHGKVPSQLEDTFPIIEIDHDAFTIPFDTENLFENSLGIFGTQQATDNFSSSDNIIEFGSEYLLLEP